jgi:hypothetical protein
MRTSTLVLVCFLTACGSAPTPASTATTIVPDACGAQASDTVGKNPGFGERCDPSIGCATGLTCQDSEFSTHPWCTKACTELWQHCDPEANGAKGFCVQMPTGWRGPSGLFCVPECLNKGECTAANPDWEICKPLEYKKEAIPGKATGAYVCQTPSSQGAPFVDSTTCDFESQFDGPKFNEAKVAAKNYCLMLATCQLRSSCTSSACCVWHAFQYLTPDGKDGSVRNDRIADLKCYPQSYDSFQGTPQVCTAWQDQCKPVPVK